MEAAAMPASRDNALAMRSDKKVGVRVRTGSLSRLALAVGLVTAALIQIELILTRLYSALFYYHYSFFSVALVMSGLAMGGLIGARWRVAAWSESDFTRRAGFMALAGSGLAAAALGALLSLPPESAFDYVEPGIVAVMAKALLFLPALVAFGAFLTTAFARRPDRIGALYAADLFAAALACLTAIPLMRAVQGPAALLTAVALAAGAALVLKADSAALKRAALSLTLVAAVGIVAQGLTGGALLRLRTKEQVGLEKWNEHSRIRVFPGKDDLMILIDKSAGTHLVNIGAREAGAPPNIQAWWDRFFWNLVYKIGRPTEQVAVIGVGGGREILGPVAHGAKVDGYELNKIILDLSRNELAPYNNFGEWPEVNLIHSEGRVGIARSGKKYDVIQASLIDTWAATAAGGFVLSENNLYTLEAWKTFLESLSDTGTLTMTRWYIPSAPAETHRLVALAAESLANMGVRDAASHVILAIMPGGMSTDATMPEEMYLANILVSRRPFAPEEVARIAALQGTENFTLLAAPGMESPDPAIRRLLDGRSRAEAIRMSPFDIRPPTDDRPFFFLLVQPGSILSLLSERPDLVYQSAYNAVRILLLLGGITAAFAIAVALFAAFGFKRANSAGGASTRIGSVYFFAIGVGYMLIQLALNQRLIVILGHPTYSLSVTLFSMLLGSGAGSFVSERIRTRAMAIGVWLAIPAALVALGVMIPALAGIESIGSPALRVGACAAVVGAIGFLLGFGFPLGIRTLAASGEAAVQKMWAVNGAASIAGSTLAALSGLTLGNRATLLAGALIYAVAAAVGITSSGNMSSPDQQADTPLQNSESQSDLSPAAPAR